MIDESSLKPYLDLGLDGFVLLGERAKKPIYKDWPHRPVTLKQAASHCRSTRGNIGVQLNDRVIVLDVDPRNFKQVDALQQFCRDFRLDLSGVPLLKTGSGGSHYFFRLPPDAGPLAENLGRGAYEGLEFKTGKGRQVVAAGSVHPMGGVYTWVRLPDGPLPYLDPMVLEALQAPKKRQMDAALQIARPDWTDSQVAAVLDALDPRDYRLHDAWLELMMSVHYATGGSETGLQLFTRWSTADPLYTDAGEQIRPRWQSLTAGAVTDKLLFKLALEHNLTVPVGVSAPESDFDALLDTADLSDKMADRQFDRESTPQSTTSWPQTGDHVVDNLNKDFALIVDGGKIRIAMEAYDPELDRHTWTMLSKADFEILLANRLAEDPTTGKVVSQANYWLRSAARRQYKGFVFDPSCQADPLSYLNTWRGFMFEPDPKGNDDKLVQLITEGLAAGDPASADYLFKWLAYMVQFPGELPGVAVVLKGNKGTGKSTLGRVMMRLFGAHAMATSDPGHITGRFNKHLRDLVLLVGEEAFWSGDKAGESRLKQLITEPSVTMEGKGVDAVVAKNRLHLLMTSNADWVAPAGLDGERRFAVFEVSDKFKGDHAFFRRLNTDLLAHGGYGRFLHRLQTIDLTGWHPSDRIPQNKALLTQKVESMDDVEAFWLNVLEDGILPGTVWKEDEPAKVLKQSIREAYQTFCFETKVRYPHNPINFAKRWSKLLPGGAKTGRMRPPAAVFDVQLDAMGRAVCYLLPPLKECRAYMSKLLGTEFAWTQSAQKDDEEDDDRTTGPGDF